MYDDNKCGHIKVLNKQIPIKLSKTGLNEKRSMILLDILLLLLASSQSKALIAQNIVVKIDQNAYIMLTYLKYLNIV